MNTPTTAQGTITPGALPVGKVHGNNPQEMVSTTVDRLHVILTDHVGKLQAENAWHAPAAFLLTTVGAFFTADFKPFFGLAAAFWQALYAIIACVSLAWLILKFRDGRRSMTVAELVVEITKRA